MISKLDIVNHMLKNVGLRKVNTLEGQNPNVVQAEASLDGTNIDFQSPGWWFNKEQNLKLVVNNRGEIIIPDGSLEITIAFDTLSASGPSAKSRYVKRGNKLYDSINHTFEINQSIYVDIVTQVEIDDMPSVASSYLKHLATWEYFIADEGDQIKAKELEKIKMTAWGKLQSAQLKALNTNALDSPAAAQLLYRIRQNGTRTNPNFPGGRY